MRWFFLSNLSQHSNFWTWLFFLLLYIFCIVVTAFILYFNFLFLFHNSFSIVSSIFYCFIALNFLRKILNYGNGTGNRISSCVILSVYFFYHGRKCYKFIKYTEIKTKLSLPSTEFFKHLKMSLKRRLHPGVYYYADRR